MKLVIQRVKDAKVVVDNKLVNKIDKGLLVYLGISVNSKKEDIDKYIKKLVNLRIFSDSEDKLNLSVKDINGEILIVSQFTLYANMKKGNRPSFTDAMPGDLAIKFYNEFVSKLKLEINVKEGLFGANMQITYTNDGPVTIVLEDLN